VHGSRKGVVRFKHGNKARIETQPLIGRQEDIEGQSWAQLADIPQEVPEDDGVFLTQNDWRKVFEGLDRHGQLLA